MYKKFLVLRLHCGPTWCRLTKVKCILPVLFIAISEKDPSPSLTLQWIFVTDPPREEGCGRQLDGCWHRTLHKEMGGVVGQGETFWLHFQSKQRFTKIHNYSEYQPSVAFTGKVEGGGARKETNTFTPPEKVPNHHLAVTGWFFGTLWAWFIMKGSFWNVRGNCNAFERFWHKFSTWPVYRHSTGLTLTQALKLVGQNGFNDGMNKLTTVK